MHDPSPNTGPRPHFLVHLCPLDDNGYDIPLVYLRERAVTIRVSVRSSGKVRHEAPANEIELELYVVLVLTTPKARNSTRTFPYTLHYDSRHC